MRDPIQKLNSMLPVVDSCWQQQQREIDLKVLDYLRINHFYGQAWGFVLQAGPCIVEESIVKEVSDAGEDA